jgi:hypothetical protein
MKRILSRIVILSIVAILMTACSSTNRPQANAANDQSQPSDQSQASNAGQPGDQWYGQAPQGTPPANNRALTIENKLAAGTLKLEGTDLAVTTDEAKTLLPLWQQIKTLSADQTATSDQLKAVYDQIQSAMTADQISSIDQLAFADIQGEMTTLGIQMPTGQPGGSPQGQGGTPDPNRTNPSGTPGAVLPPQGTPDAQGTPGGRGGGRNGGGMIESVFVDPLITLLQARSGN